VRHFLEELDDLQELLLEMAGRVEFAIRRAISALVDRDEEQAQEVLRNEARINQMEIEIDDLAVRPAGPPSAMAKDLRFLTAAIKINNDLERMGDLAVNIVERALSLIHQPPIKPLVIFRRWARWSIPWCETAWTRSFKRDGQLARGVLLSDDAVDDLRDRVCEELVAFMEKDPSTISRALDLIMVARNLERVADHATNIAEDVLFLAQGIDVRHHSETGQ